MEFVERESGTAMVIGGVDTGKTTLILAVALRLLSRGKMCGLIDSDIGQSVSGAPCMITLTVPDISDGRVSLGEPVTMYFIGSTSPSGHVTKVIQGVGSLCERVRRKGIPFILVDTTGMIQGYEGLELKLKKAELIRPDCIYALQRKDELVSILTYLRKMKGIALEMLPIPDGVVTRSMDERRERREAMFRKHFRDASVFEIMLSSISVDGCSGMLVPNLLVGLKDRDGFALAMGRVVDRDERSLSVLTRLKDLSGVRSIEPGSLLLDSDFREIGRPIS